MDKYTPISVIAEPKGGSLVAQNKLANLTEVRKGPYSTSDELISNTYDAEILWVRLGHKIDADFMNACPNLKIIATATTGLDHIDIQAADEKGITVVSLKGEQEFLETVTATAEHCWALMLNLVRRIKPASKSVENENWNRDLFWGSELSGKVLGIIGLGRLGVKISQYASAFDMKVIACDPAPFKVPTGVDIVTLSTLLKEADVVSLHVPLANDTNGLIGQEELAMMKPHSLLINTSRGAVIDEEALLVSLDAGRIGGAALDVLKGEEQGDLQWMKSNALIKYANENENLIITPHIGGATFESVEKTECFIVEKIIEVLSQNK